MAVNYAAYKAKIIQAQKDARNEQTIDAALDKMAQGFADALEIAVSQMEVSTTVSTPNTTTGTGIGTVS